MRLSFIFDKCVRCAKIKQKCVSFSIQYVNRTRRQIKTFKIIFFNFDDAVYTVVKFKFSRICHLTQLHVIVMKKKFTLKKQIAEFNSNFRSIRLILQFMFDSYRHDFRLKFIDFEIFANEFSFEKKNKNKNENEKDDELMNKSENNFELNTIIVF